MKAHTSDFKTNIAQMGKQLDSKITYTISGTTTELGKEELNSVTPHYKADILKSVMKQLDIDSNVDIPIGTIVNYQFGVKVGDSYEYLNYGNYIVNKSEKQEDLKSYKITCYDKMLYSMVDYTTPQVNGNDITYPITIRNYITAICSHLGLVFKNENDTFINWDKEIPNELYLSEDTSSLNYKFRDVLDELAQATASTICINKNDELEIRYINDTDEKNLFKNTIANNYDMSSGRCEQMNIANGKRIIYTYDSSSAYVARVYKLIDISDKVGSVVRAKATITINGESNTPRFGVGLCNEDVSNRTQYGTTSTSDDLISFTIPEIEYEQKYLAVWLYVNAGGTVEKDDYVDYTNIVITLDNEDMTYNPDGDIIDEEYLKDTNIRFGKKYGPINSIVLSRSANADNIMKQDEISIIQNGLCELKIEDNQIMNDNDRDDYLNEIFNQLNGLEYFINDYSSPGIMYYDMCDRYTVKIGNIKYKCIMFNDEALVTQGLQENIITEMPVVSETDYSKADETDRKINQAYIIVNKQNQTISQYTSKITNVENDNIQIKEKFNDYTPTSRTVQIENSVNQLQTDTYTKTEINTKLTDGSVTKVQTVSGTFDENGMTYEKSGAPSKTTINEVGVGVKKTEGSNDYILFAGYVDNNNTQYSKYKGQTIVATDNIVVDNYLVVGTHSRFEDFSGGTGCFYI